MQRDERTLMDVWVPAQWMLDLLSGVQILGNTAKAVREKTRPRTIEEKTAALEAEI